MRTVSNAPQVLQLQRRVEFCRRERQRGRGELTGTLTSNALSATEGEPAPLCTLTYRESSPPGELLEPTV